MAADSLAPMEGIGANAQPKDNGVTGSNPLLKGANIVHWYGKLKVVDNVSVSVMPGESVAIISPSGSGKSTLLRLLLQLEEPTEGTASLLVPPSGIGAVFQEDSLLPWLNIVENICLLNKLHRKPVDETECQKLLECYGLADFKEYYPSQLSGGMKQKVALCRLLLYLPRLYVLDESMANMDDLSRFGLCDALHSQVAQDGSSILFVTHNLTDALHLADRILLGTSRPLRFTKEINNPLPRRRDYHARFSHEFQAAVDQLRVWIGQD
jgi:NitT/TauT family transport system ATP-binding protein